MLSSQVKFSADRQTDTGKIICPPINRCEGIKSFGPCQPAQIAQADMGRNLLLSLNFLYVKGQGDNTI